MRPKSADFRSNRRKCDKSSSPRNERERKNWRNLRLTAAAVSWIIRFSAQFTCIVSSNGGTNLLFFIAYSFTGHPTEPRQNYTESTRVYCTPNTKLENTKNWGRKMKWQMSRFTFRFCNFLRWFLFNNFFACLSWFNSSGGCCCCCVVVQRQWFNGHNRIDVHVNL